MTIKHICSHIGPSPVPAGLQASQLWRYRWRGPYVLLGASYKKGGENVLKTTALNRLVCITPISGHFCSWVRDRQTERMKTAWTSPGIKSASFLIPGKSWDSALDCKCLLDQRLDLGRPASAGVHFWGRFSIFSAPGEERKWSISSSHFDFTLSMARQL